ARRSSSTGSRDGRFASGAFLPTRRGRSAGWISGSAAAEGGDAMDLGLTNSIVLVTGGSKGIGLECARTFAREGARVAIASRDPGNLQRAAELLEGEGIPVLPVAAERRNAEDARKMAKLVEERRGPIDILVNSAG